MKELPITSIHIFFCQLIFFNLCSLLSSLPFGGVTEGNGSDCGYGSDPQTIRESEARPWSRTGRVKWSNESELELELSPGSLRTICLGGILPEVDKRCTLKKTKKKPTQQHLSHPHQIYFAYLLTRVNVSWHVHRWPA